MVGWSKGEPGMILHTCAVPSSTQDNAPQSCNKLLPSSQNSAEAVAFVSDAHAGIQMFCDAGQMVTQKDPCCITLRCNLHIES